MFRMLKKKNRYPVSNRNSNHEKQVILLMIPNRDGAKLSRKDDGIILL